jgi:hypothetical protein
MQFRKYVIIAAGCSLAAIGLWAQQSKKGMTKEDMLNMPYAKVKATLSNPATRAKALEMAKKNGVMLMGGIPVEGQSVTLKGELTDANCYLSKGEHGHEHALCAKACVNAGSPVVFLAQDGSVYMVLTPKDGRPLPGNALDELGQPGVTVQGKLVKAHGVQALAIEAVHL